MHVPREMLAAQAVVQQYRLSEQPSVLGSGLQPASQRGQLISGERLIQVAVNERIRFEGHVAAPSNAALRSMQSRS